MNPLHPDRMTPDERRALLCRILAAGLCRLHQRGPGKHPPELEKFNYTIPPTNAVMQLRLTGETHDDA